MTIDLDKLEQLHATATPGPWEADTAVRGDCVVWGPDGRFISNAQAEPHWIEHPGEKRAVQFDVDRRDTEWIAAIHNAAPALIAELREARAAIERVKALAYDPDDADEYAPTAIVVDATLLQRALDGARD